MNDFLLDNENKILPETMLDNNKNVMNSTIELPNNHIFSESNKNTLDILPFLIFEFENISSEEQNNIENNIKTFFLSDNKKKIKPKFFVNETKRGRKTSEKRKEIRIHDKNTSDNLLKKIQVHFLNFIINYLNDIIKYLHYDKFFLKIDYRFKSNISKNFFNRLKNCQIGNIISTKISEKYKTIDNNYNRNLYHIYQGNEVLNKILSENYLFLFRKIYYKSNRIINLKEYGLDANIKLSPRVKMYKDLLKEKEKKIDNKEYQTNLNKIINQHFFSNSLFEITKNNSHKE